jgi:glycosyltransferase involved in cell wall biosynthesis
MKVSVIIATKDRRESLLRTLRSLQDQTLADFEIIVVDNAADPHVAQAIEDFNETARIKVRYIAHDSGGISGARNVASQCATSDLLAFTDDDLTFDPMWLSSHIDKFTEHAEMAAAGGHAIPFWEQPPPEWLLDYIGDSKSFPVLALIRLSDNFSISSDNIFFGCNMVIRREVLAECGGFQPSYVDGETVGSSEWGIVLRLQKAGRMIGYNPDAIVYHHIPAHRMTVDYICKWAWHAGAGEMYERWLHRRRTPLAMVRETARLFLVYWKLWLKAWTVTHRRDPKAVDTRFRSSLGRCKLNYVWRMLTDQRVRKALELGGAA